MAIHAASWGVEELGRARYRGVKRSYLVIQVFTRTPISNLLIEDAQIVYRRRKSIFDPEELYKQEFILSWARVELDFC